ncbi:hypothetical protein B0T21DRAFT_362050 [Apiosordaria backusii]|uniref:Uncharacterized protein n=1 Tax=Apiosordaria backusii TaxID=314023 RepID=A0AA40EHL3_9PEZI|nr:hypothetical protein B0T21DRAFT_362050 [Apiosordaria backusii]
MRYLGSTQCTATELHRQTMPLHPSSHPHSWLLARHLHSRKLIESHSFLAELRALYPPRQSPLLLMIPNLLPHHRYHRLFRRQPSHPQIWQRVSIPKYLRRPAHQPHQKLAALY